MGQAESYDMLVSAVSANISMYQNGALELNILVC